MKNNVGDTRTQQKGMGPVALVRKWYTEPARKSTGRNASAALREMPQRIGHAIATEQCGQRGGTWSATD